MGFVAKLARPWWLGACASLAALSFAPGANAAVEKAGGFSFVTKEGKVESAPVSIAYEDLEVPCPGKTRVVSGGLTSDAGYGRFVFNGVPYDDGDANDKPDNGWRFTGMNYARGNVKFEGKAVCTKKLDPSYPEQSVKVDAGSQLGAGVECPGNRVPVGGGMSGKVAMNSSYPATSFWGMWADNITSKDQKVRSYAVCVEPSLRLEFDSSSSSIGPNTGSGGFSSCVLGEVGISGGHSNSGGFLTIGIRALNPSPTGFGHAIDNYSTQTVSTTTYTVCFDPSV